MTTISRRELLTICTVTGGLTLASWELFDLSLPTLSLPTTSSQPSPTAPTTPSATPTDVVPETQTAMPTDTPTERPTATPTETSTDVVPETQTAASTDTPTATPTETSTATPASSPTSLSLSSPIQFMPKQTFTSDEYGYQIAIPEPWVVKNSEGGNDIKVATANELAFLKVVISQDRGRPLTTALPGVVGITDHDLAQLTREGYPALRFERSYRATTTGPRYRVEGLIIRAAGYKYVAQCGVVIQSSDASNDTDASMVEPAPESVVWTPEIEQATTNIVESFTLGSKVNNP